MPERSVEPASYEAIGPFQVSQGRILNGKGARFAFKGASMFDYLYGGHYPDRRYFIETGKKMGLNLIRVNVDSRMINEMNRIDEIVQLAQELELVVEIQNAPPTPIPDEEYDFIAFLGARYAGLPHVWLNPANEMNCQGSLVGCLDPQVWKLTSQRLLKTVRDAGFQNPVIINGLDWGGYLAGGSWGENKSVKDYLPPTADTNLVLGIHRYANYEPELDECREYTNWGRFTDDYAVTMDELGFANNWGYGFLEPNAEWSKQMVSWTAKWVRGYGGSGVIAFTWYDQYCEEGYWQNCLVDVNLTPTAWGRIFGLSL